MSKIFYFVLSEPRKPDRYFKVKAKDKQSATWLVVDMSEGEVCSIVPCSKEWAEKQQNLTQLPLPCD